MNRMLTAQELEIARNVRAYVREQFPEGGLPDDQFYVETSECADAEYEELTRRLTDHREGIVARHKANHPDIEIIACYDQWIVTDVGLECTEIIYLIEPHQLHKYWPLRMGRKEWVDIRSFLLAFHRARHHFFPDIYPNLHDLEHTDNPTTGQ